MFTSRKKRIRQSIIARYGKNPFDSWDIDHTRENLDSIRIYYDECRGNNQEEELNEKQHENLKNDLNDGLKKSDKSSKNTKNAQQKENITSSVKKNAVVDEITWNDLEMDDVFLRINQTKSYIGEQFLYKSLHELDSDRDWTDFEYRIEYFEQNESERIKIEEKLAAIGKKDEDYYITMFINNSDVLGLSGGFVYHILQVLLAVSLVLSICTKNIVWIGMAIGVAVTNLLIYTFTKNKYEAFLYSLGSIKQLVQFCDMMISRPQWKDILYSQGVEEDVKKFRKLVRWVGNFQIRKHSVIAGNEMALLQEYLLGVTLYDVAVYNHIMKAINGRMDAIWRLYEFAGSVDMAIAIASFRRSKEQVCVPVFSDSQKINIQGVCHPMLEKSVSNNFNLAGNAMVTGANASGKSTFMKAIAINAILAQTIHTCTATSFSMPGIGIMTSMALRDDIISGESYYVREVKHLKRMLDSVNEDNGYLFVIDEIFKGTNTRERLAASEAVLQYLMDKNCHVIVATHDMELAEKMGMQYKCYHFDSYMEDNDIHFDYLIREGIGSTTNAIDLLTCFDFPDIIVKCANNFLNV